MSQPSVRKPRITALFDRLRLRPHHYSLSPFATEEGKHVRKAEEAADTERNG
jgi:hypothetical protein